MSEMVKLNANGVYLVNGKLSSAADVAPSEARKNTIAYSILNSHNVSGNDEALDACLTELSQIEGIVTTRSTSGEIEVISQTAGKGNGILRLAASKGIHPSEIAVAGDSMNDLSMFRAAGLSVAVPNAMEAVKAEATQVMRESDGGVAEYILDSFIRV